MKGSTTCGWVRHCSFSWWLKYNQEPNNIKDCLRYSEVMLWCEVLLYSILDNWFIVCQSNFVRTVAVKMLEYIPYLMYSGASEKTMIEFFLRNSFYLICQKASLQVRTMYSIALEVHRSSRMQSYSHSWSKTHLVIWHELVYKRMDWF